MASAEDDKKQIWPRKTAVYFARRIREAEGKGTNDGGGEKALASGREKRRRRSAQSSTKGG